MQPPCGKYGLTLTDNGEISAPYETVPNPQSREVWRISAERERNRRFGQTAQSRALRENPAILRVLSVDIGNGEYWSQGKWRRERNWGPTFSTFAQNHVFQGRPWTGLRYSESSSMAVTCEVALYATGGECRGPPSRRRLIATRKVGPVKHQAYWRGSAAASAPPGSRCGRSGLRRQLCLGIGSSDDFNGELQVGALFISLMGFTTELTRAFSSEVDTGSREENASNQNHRARF